MKSNRVALLFCVLHASLVREADAVSSALVFETDAYVQTLQAKLTDVGLSIIRCGELGSCVALSPEVLADVVAVVGSPRNVSQLEQMPNLRLLQSTHYMATNFTAVPSRVTVTNYQPDWRGTYGVEPIAEWVLAAAFEWNYRIGRKQVSFANCAWGKDAPSRCPPVSELTTHPTLMSRTMGVLGYGAIGEAVAKRSAALGMRTIATKRTGGPFDHPPPPLAWLSNDNDKLLREADFIAVTTPGSVVGLINSTALALMKPGAVLIPVSANPVDFDALYEALDKRSIGGAVIDVWPQGCWRFPEMTCGPPYGTATEPYSGAEIEKLDNAIVLPGMSMRDDQFWEGSAAYVVDNLRALLQGGSLKGIVRNATSTQRFASAASISI